MPSIALCIQQILDLASQYTRDPTPAMRKRDAIGKELGGSLAIALEEVRGLPGLAELDLRVKAGGWEGSFGPLPWVRVYSKLYAPSAQQGIYLTYLFAADGSRAYLSLNQGTSVPKPGGGMRTTTDTRTLLYRAAQARSALGDHIEAEGAANTMMSIDLAGQDLESPASRYRARAYEAANILAREYLAGQIPPDDQLLEELVGMLPMLAELYGVAPMPLETPNITEPGLPAKAAAALSNKRLLDREARKEVELHAEDHAIDYFRDLGWEVKRVGHLRLGYDLECTSKNGKTLHVEVKGTQNHGEKVTLTGNEVDHNRRAAECGADHALYVVSQIKVSRESGIQCSGGEPNRLWPWSVDDDDLIATEYSYKVPRAQR
jgi:hypothetical protein